MPVPASVGVLHSGGPSTKGCHMIAVRPLSDAVRTFVTLQNGQWRTEAKDLHLDPRRVKLTQLLLGLGTAMVGIIGLVSAPSEEYEGWKVGLVVVISLSSFPVALRWILGGWPSPNMLTAYLVFSDLSITICLVSKVDRLSAVGGTVLFAVVTAFVVIAMPALPCLLHILYSVIVLAFIAWNTAMAEVASNWVIAAHTLSMLLVFFSPFVLVVYVSELRSRAHDSLVDPLTGLHNRRGLYAAVEAIVATDPKATGRVIFAAVIDVDGMKEVNDNFGHHTGDAVLIELSQHLRMTTSDTWIAARIGGDEFACVAVGGPNRTAPDAGVLTNTLQQTRMISGLTVSVGAASTELTTDRPTRESVEEAIRLADTQMYSVKNERKRQRRIPS